DRAALAHARALLCLRRDEGEAALLELSEQRTGDEDLDLRLELLRGAALVQTGDAEGGLATATRVRRRAGARAELVVEARVLRAMALDAVGDRAEALEVVRSLGKPMLRVLLGMGLPRAKALAQIVEAEGDPGRGDGADRALGGETEERESP
ncbi:MAG: hypothetical protein KC416_02485, partial [Myxococcales bacterium]|nr:hypothetical protein [Myxococcales bacterium]